MSMIMHTSITGTGNNEQQQTQFIAVHTSIVPPLAEQKLRSFQFHTYILRSHNKHILLNSDIPIANVATMDNHDMITAKRRQRD